jgi:uncharacterized protein
MDAGSGMKARLRADLRRAMKERRATEAKVIRTLVAAIDNAEAPPVRAQRSEWLQHRFQSGSAEVERLLLSRLDVRDVLLREIHERERAAEELEHLKMLDQANALRAEALLTRRYITAE